MREMLRRKVKQNSAFTMAEMLVVVAITVVLLGISMLAISNLVTNLKMKELDDYAKTIYLEAQNQLSAKEVEGGLNRYYEQFVEEYESHFLATVPQDYSYDSDNESWKSLCYVTKSDEITKTLILEQSNIYQSDGDYIIELNPQTGDIYGVFYWEKNEKISYEDIQNLVDRSQKERADMKLGYYGGIVGETTTATVVLDQQVELINAEELYLKVSYDASARLLRYYNTALTIEYMISNEAGTITWEGEIDTSNMKENAGRLECYMLLDSLGYSFAEISKDSGLLPGENLSIVVRSTYERGSDLCVDSNELEPLVGNSLFGDNTSDEMIEIANLRHLRNLDENYVSNSLYPRSNGKSLTIQLTRDIDFSSNNYVWNIVEAEDGTVRSADYVGVGKAQSPIDAMTPIANRSLLSNSVVAGSYNGSRYKLKNFVVKAEVQSASVGLFASASNVEFNDIIIEDITVDGTGYANAGALVGEIAGGMIRNCGVYLTTYENVDGAQSFYSKQPDATGVYSNDMERRYDTFKVTATSNAGGLIGTATGATITDSFAAIQVDVSANVAGGLVGSMTGGSITNSYASGDVTGKGSVGGLIGVAVENVSVTDAYTTGNVYGENYFGGFLGASTNSSYTNCTSYGEVLKKDMGILDGAAAGGFVYASNAAGNTYNNCRYMTQTGYNKSGLSDPQVIAESAISYKRLIEEAEGSTLGVGSSYPYDDTLFGMLFPFAKLPNQTEHYGDWAGEYAIDTSLVYYEKYADGKYGYYCVTYIADDEHTWLLNTLRDEVCVEDGYALMTKYNLTEFNFDLYIGYADATATPNYSSDTARTDGDVSVSNEPITVVDISQAEAGTSDKYKHAFRLVQQGKLSFEGYPADAYNDVTGEMAANAEVEDAFSVNGMYIYQLPYDLQTTDRYAIDNFYDRLVIRDAKAKGSDTVVIDDMTFFYCPHFAKTAVNLADTEGQINEFGVITYEPRTNPTNVFVRSARQLNALGRFPYYWNSEGGSGDIVILQETDVNFSTYATGHKNGEKLYCGQEFDLTKFGTDYANQPIGQPDIDSNDSINYQQFKNTYDGQCNIIYDYCIESDRQFVGLFGEIKEAEIQNVFMLISDAPTGNAGTISGTYQDLKSYGTNGKQKRTGVGALVGLDYDGANKIDNCVAAGYTVKYTINPIKDTSIYRQPLGIAVGGLIGFGMSDISNCAAVNDVKVIANTHYDRDGKNGIDRATFLGGFAGSYFYNTITNCYSGGTLDVEWNGYAVFRLRIGGFCPGAMDTPAESLSISSAGVQYVNIYSYTELDEDVWDIGRGTRYEDEDYDDFNWYFPLVSRMYCTYNGDPWTLAGDIYSGWDTSRKSGSSASSGISVPGFAYYITEHQEKHIAHLSDTVKGYFQKDGANYPQTCEGTTYTVLSNVEILRAYYQNKLTGEGRTFIDFGRATATNTHPESYRLNKIAYPYPAFVKNAENEYVHYGDWPTDEEEVAGNYPLYFEEYDDGSYGVYYLAIDKKASGEEVVRVENHLVADDSKKIVRSGYGYMSLQAVDGMKPLFYYEVQSGLDGGIYSYNVYAFSKEELYAAVGTTSTASGNERDILIPFTYETLLVSGGEILSVVESGVKNLYVNPNFAAAISMTDNELGTESLPLQVRTPEQFANLSVVHESNVHMLQTHSIDLAEGHTPVNVLYSHVYDGGSDNGFQIRNATNVLFIKNEGTIQNMSVTGSRINVEDNISIVVNTNAGTASDITVKDARITSTAIVAGFTLMNTGTIDKVNIIAENAYKDVQIKGYRAHGFTGQNSGTITNSLVTGVVEGASRAAGFAAINTNTIRTCYSNVKVSVTETMAQTAGFVLTSSSTADKLTLCYASGSVEGYEAYGFMCEGKASKCYTVSSVNGAYMYGFGGSAASNSAENCYWGYDQKAGYNMAIYRNPMGVGKPMALARLMRGDAGDDYAEDVSPDVPYTAALGTEYPYPSVGLIHYGDWQPPSVEKQNTVVENNTLNDRWKEAGLFYYERYMDGSYGIYAIGMTRYNGDNPDVMINTLAASDEPVLSSGYGVFYQDTGWNIQRQDAWWYGMQDITYYDANVLDGFTKPAGVENSYKFRYITDSGVKDTFTCIFTYGNNNNQITISINSKNFNRPR